MIMSMNDRIVVNIKLYKQEVKGFERLFGIKLKPYFDNITGFNIVKFDKHFVKTPDGKSLAEVIRTKYGDEAEALCLRLIVGV